MELPGAKNLYMYLIMNFKGSNWKRRNTPTHFILIHKRKTNKNEEYRELRSNIKSWKRQVDIKALLIAKLESEADRRRNEGAWMRDVL